MNMATSEQNRVGVQIARCREWIEAALAYGGDTHDYEHVAYGILEGAMQLWPAEDGCLVTELLQYPKKKVLHIFLAGGRLQTLTDMHDDVIAWAKSQGCTALTLSGRKGWVRALESFDWEPTLTTLSKEI